ncbi:MAG: translation elongation factor EF-1 subunit alpha [Thermoplasmata archaeon]|nr:translation elongation factor EF-1 subunit alpha [Thermoplasmata archaeon]OYT48248.1 MAG: translation elongation factor EF-1 subunit alpha [Thermoplasmatales archaeon ex4484_36]RLF56202.1 MAG: translation elongation factor EF-1 subunit alpha [Thermoplasmata archaeon]RLF72156.1 MAG: translation elongation factor EF-1 subunit alpha [Thermoplasmata archaeon]RLF72670.1 MAG: translation elongation factor EF-1 subunit alpha [Thermoplasmata archaeon]
MPADKPHMNLVFIGHVDHGKSTLVGRLLYEAGAIDPHLIEKYRQEAEAKGKGTFEFAWVMDREKEERERGLTIDVAHRRFDTDKYYFTIIDAPGHRDFVKNMITGTSQADAAVLVVAAPEGVMAQTKEHVFLARTLGIQQLIVAINKMDATKPPYDEKRFNEVKEQVTQLLKLIGWDLNKVKILPVSAYMGDNVMKPSSNLGWWKGEALIDALNSLEVPPKPIDLPLRIPVQDVYSITGIGTVPVGRVETGVLKVGDRVVFNPPGVSGEVKSIEMHHEPMQKAEPGDNIGFNVRGVGKKDIRRGDVAGHPDNPPTVARTFTGRIVVLQHPSVITAGYTPVFHCHTAQVACRFEELLQKLDPRTGQVKEENPNFIKTGEIAVVKLRPTRPMVIERVQDIPQLGRFAIRDMGVTVAAGMCLDVEKR